MGPAAIADDACQLSRPRASGWRASVSAGLLDSRLDFGAFDADVRQWSVLASVGRRITPRLTLQAGAGVLVSGELATPTGVAALEPGWVAAASATWLALDGRGRRPFVSATLGFAHARSETADGASYRATDASFSLAVGKSLGRFAPYLAAKVFGGPVSWRFMGDQVTGTDVHRFQLALGVAAALPGGLDLLVEGVPLGARGATLALGRGF